MSAITFGICSACISLLHCPQGCATAKKSGLDAMQIYYGLKSEGFPLSDKGLQQEWVKAAHEHNITLSGLAFNEVLAQPMTITPKSDAFYVLLHKAQDAVECAAGMGIPMVIVAGFQASAIHNEADLAYTLEFLRHLAPVAQSCGVALGWENDLMPDKAQEAIAAVGNPALKLHLDSFNHIYVKGVAYAPLLEALLPMAAEDIHLKDGQESSASRLLGQGKGDTLAVLGELKRLGFSGRIVLENYYERPAFSPQLPPLEMLARDLATLKTALA